MRNALSIDGCAPPAERFVPRQYIAPNGSFDPTQVAALGIPREQLLKLYRGMLLIRIIDERMLTLQRQGRISFYGEARGQEAAVVGTAAGLAPQDFILPALREAGAALYRGLPLRTYISQIYGNENDVTKGRQMPCHPGTKQARYVTMSSCIATQLPAQLATVSERIRSGQPVTTRQQVVQRLHWIGFGKASIFRDDA